MILQFVRIVIRRGPHHLGMLVRHPLGHSRQLMRSTKRLVRNFALMRAGLTDEEIVASTAKPLDILWLLVVESAGTILWQAWFMVLFSWVLLYDKAAERTNNPRSE